MKKEITFNINSITKIELCNEVEMSMAYQESLLENFTYTLCFSTSPVNYLVEYKKSYSKSVRKYLLIPFIKTKKFYKAGYYIVGTDEKFHDSKIDDLLKKEVYYSEIKQNFIFKPVVHVHLNDGSRYPYICRNIDVAQKLYNHLNSLYNSFKYNSDLIDKQHINVYINKISTSSNKVMTQSDVDSLKYKSDIIEY